MKRSSYRMPVGPALEQLRELISILHELGNASPRDNSFKQWRQVTLTLLQRVWAGDQARAMRFRRIPFSAPSARADARAVRESFIRGVKEATAYLESLAHELEADARGPDLNLKRPPEVAGPSEFKRVEPAAPPRPAAPVQPAGPLEPSPFELTGPSPRAAQNESASADDAPTTDPPAQPARQQAAPPRPDAGRSTARPRQRLKDMLGFSDEEAAASSTPASTSAPVSPPASRPTAAPPSVTPPPAVPVPPPSREPASASEPPPRAPHDERPAPPLSLVPDPPPSAGGPDDEEFDFDFDFPDLAAPEAESEAEPEHPPITLREMIDREPSAGAASHKGVAGELLAMAARLDQLGVPKHRRAMVRAALLDLADQIESPPVDWAGIRQAFAFVLDYPQIARRVIPMLVPYLDEAA